MADEQAPYEMFGHLKCWTFRELNFTNPNDNIGVEVGQAVILDDNKIYIVTEINGRKIRFHQLDYKRDRYVDVPNPKGGL